MIALFQIPLSVRTSVMVTTTVLLILLILQKKKIVWAKCMWHVAIAICVDRFCSVNGAPGWIGAVCMPT